MSTPSSPRAAALLASLAKIRAPAVHSPSRPATTSVQARTNAPNPRLKNENASQSWNGPLPNGSKGGPLMIRT